MNPAYILLAVPLLLFGGKWEMPALFQKKPPTAQLTAAQTELATAQAGQAKAEAQLATARAERDALKEKQLDFTQQMVAGAKRTLDNMPAAEMTATAQVAREFVNRADAGFIAARGALSAEAKAEIDRLYDATMAAKDHELRTLRDALDTSNGERAQLAHDKAVAEAKIPALSAEVVTRTAEVQVKDAKAETLISQIKVYADTTAAQKAKNGTLDAYAGHLVRILIGLAALYFLIHWLLPVLGQSYPNSRWLAWLSAAAKNATTAHL